MTDDVQFQCAECGKVFPADPDTMLEQMLGPAHERDEKKAEQLVDDGVAFAPEQIADASAEMLAEYCRAAAEKMALPTLFDLDRVGAGEGASEAAEVAS